MIGRGTFQDVHLYEVTEQDLLLEHQMNQAYRCGNILMFTDRRTVELGRELARADDLHSAREYLNTRCSPNLQSNPDYEHRLESLTTRITCQDESLKELSKQIAQRDELLRDLAETLNIQKQDNELLHVQLAKAHEQLAADELKHSELFDDLQFISGETHAIETALERVMEEKFQLEQELAERITELIELNLQNDDLRKQLDGPLAGPECTPLQGHKTQERPQGRPQAAGIAAPVRANLPGTVEGAARAETMDSGKQIHILHEFPTTTRKSPAAQVNRLAFALLKICVILAVSLLLLGTASVVATAQVNNISFGTALDLIIESLGFSAGFF